MNLPSEFIFAFMMLLLLKKISALSFTSNLLILVSVFLSKTVLPLFENEFLNLIWSQVSKLQLHLIELLVLVNLLSWLRFLWRLNLTHLEFKLTNFGNISWLQHWGSNWSKSINTATTVDRRDTWEADMIWEATLTILSLPSRLTFIIILLVIALALLTNKLIILGIRVERSTSWFLLNLLLILLLVLPRSSPSTIVIFLLLDRLSISLEDGVWLGSSRAFKLFLAVVLSITFRVLIQ